jgi:hypothetical protein
LHIRPAKPQISGSANREKGDRSDNSEQKRFHISSFAGQERDGFHAPRQQ